MKAENPIDHRNVIILSADNYRMSNGIYHFDPRDTRPHDQCYLDYLSHLTYLSNTPDVLIVDNTNLAAWELAPYVRLAEVKKIKYQILQFIGTIKESFDGSTHGLPLSKIVHMHNLMYNERLPGHWKVDSILSSTIIANEKS